LRATGGNSGAAATLPVFCSDPLSSNAYATEEILLVLSLGGLTLLHLTWPVAAVVIVLLIVVVASYRQTCHASPNGGAAYAVRRANLRRDAALAAASALLVDYVLTVAVPPHRPGPLSRRPDRHSGRPCPSMSCCHAGTSGNATGGPRRYLRLPCSPRSSS
jgi:hypothetical protein